MVGCEGKQAPATSGKHLGKSRQNKCAHISETFFPPPLKTKPPGEPTYRRGTSDAPHQPVGPGGAQPSTSAFQDFAYPIFSEEPYSHSRTWESAADFPSIYKASLRASVSSTSSGCTDATSIFTTTSTTSVVLSDSQNDLVGVNVRDLSILSPPANPASQGKPEKHGIIPEPPYGAPLQGWTDTLSTPNVTNAEKDFIALSLQTHLPALRCLVPQNELHLQRQSMRYRRLCAVYIHLFAVDLASPAIALLLSARAGQLISVFNQLDERASNQEWIDYLCSSEMSLRATFGWNYATCNVNAPIGLATLPPESASTSLRQAHDAFEILLLQ